MFRFAAALLLPALVLCSTDIKEEDGVLVLTKGNFETAIEAHKNILVEFYAPWCGHCKNLAPEYAKAAGQLADMKSDIKLAKVDATQESELAEKFGVRGYPTLKFFRNANPIEYNGGRTADGIVNWVVKKTGPPAKALASLTELEAFIKENNVAIVGYFTDPESSAAKNYLEVASVVEDHAFGIVNDASIITENKAEDGKIWLYKKFDEGESVYSGAEDPNELRKFIASESLPLIVEFNHETAQKIFGGDIKSHLLFFLSKEKGEFESILDPIKPIAKESRSKLLFVVINVDEPDHQRILEFFGLSTKEVPTMRIIRLEDEMSKFKPPTNNLGPDSVKTFLDDFIEGKLKEHLLSQELPEDWDKEPVKVLVATNFDEVVFDKSKNVLVEFYAPWCGHCKQLVPIYDKLAESFSKKEDVLIAKIDATANELEHTKIASFPTLKLYKKDTNEVVDYNGERTLEGLTKFLESGGEFGKGAPEEEEEDEDDDLPRKDEL
uniref:Protein disulfide-isomerase n=3 Tax=Lygus hesperus TaxID=30085 RepID=A0A0A9YM47_LYGHE